MTLHLKIPSKVNNLSPKISVIGVGGAGGNVINSMIESGIKGVSFLSVNTDSQALSHSSSEETLQLGPTCTQGLGAGADPDIGKQSAEEVSGEIKEYLEDTNMVFLTAGMGGGTGTGASPIIAKIAKDLGILIVGVVTKPLDYEGKRRMKQAEEGISELQKYVDNLIIIPNQNIFHLAKTDTTYTDAFKLANDVLIDGVKSIMDLMLKPGIINHDFADVRAVMSETGKVHMGTAISQEEDRALKATEEAISNPLLEYNSMSGAKGVLVNITGGEDITLHEVDQALNRIREESDENANLIWGLTKDENFIGKFKISVISTGIESENYLQNQANNYNISEFDKYKETNLKEVSINKEVFLGESETYKEEGNEIKNEDILDKDNTGFSVKLNNTEKLEKKDSETQIRDLEEKAKEFRIESEKKEKKVSIFSKIFSSNNTKPKIINKTEEDKLETDPVLERNNEDWNEIEKKQNNTEIKNEDIFHETNKKGNPLRTEQLNINDKDSNYEEDLLQIPAFLRRQAN